MAAFKAGAADQFRTDTVKSRGTAFSLAT